MAGEKPQFSTGCPEDIQLHPLFGFPSGLYTVRVDFQRTPRRPRVPPRYPNRIREYRIKLGQSQASLAKAVGRSLSMISAWERGRTLPTLPNLFRLSKALSTFAEALYPTFYVPRGTYPRS
jgi:DNA-binding XRE family transcriptional regulator